MKLTNIRQDSVNCIVAQNEGRTLALHNEDGSEVTASQLDAVRRGRTLATVDAAGLVVTVRDAE